MGRVRLLAHRRHRGRDREDPAGARRRRRHAVRRPADVPRPVAAHPRRPARRRAARPTRSTARSRGCPRRSKGALQSLYGNYEKSFRRWEETRAGDRRLDTAGVHRRLQQHQRLEARLRLHRRLGEAAARRRHASSSPASCDCSPTSTAGGWSAPPERRSSSTPTQLESGEAMSAEFKAARRRRDRGVQGRVRQRFPGRDADELTDEDLLREVMNTVGKPGKLGEHVRCVVSRVDAHRGLGRQHRHPHPRRAGVRHPAAVRAGRRPRPAPTCYAVGDDGRFEPEYAEVYGVPFSFIPGLRASGPDPKPGPIPTRVPRHRGPHRLRDHLPSPGRLPLGDRPTSTSRPTSSTSHGSPSTPATCRPAPRSPPIVGETEEHRLDDVRGHARAAGRLRARQAAPRPLLPRTDDDGSPVPSARGCSRSWSRSPSAGSPTASRSRTTPSSALLPWPSAPTTAVEKIYLSIVARPGRRAPARAAAPPLRTGRLDPLRRLRHHARTSTSPTRSGATSATSSCDSGWEATSPAELEGCPRSCAAT